MKRLTDRQREIYDYLVQHYKEYGYPPTIREIGFRFSIRSTKGVVDHLNALERKGYIKRAMGKSRALELNYIEPEDHQGIPLLGRIAAGVPTLAEENIEDTFMIDPSFLRGDGEFLLRVRGESMVEAHISDGDMILVRPTTEVRNGEIIAALIGDEATVKYFHKQDGEIELRPANKKMKPIQIDPADGEFRILGKVVGLLRYI